MQTLWGMPLAAMLALLALVAWATPAAAEEEVRILLASGKAVVRIEAPGLAIYDGKTGDRVATATGKGRAELVPAGGGVGLKGPEVRAEAEGPFDRLFVESEHGVRVEGRLYLGRITVEREAKKGSLIVINRLPLETYLLGIVGSEMSPEWPLEALKAQAVAARTYALERHMMMQAADRPYDLEATVLSQVYQGAERIRPSVVTAVVSTRGEVLSYRHQLAQALFHSTCGGKTVSAERAFGNRVPYLVPEPCPWCRDSTRYRWSMSLVLDKLEKQLQKAGLLSGKGKLSALERGTTEGSLLATVGKKTVELSAKQVRAALGYMVMMSDRFTATTTEGRVEIEGVGFGHGVGMCQWGARGQAERGLGHVEILEHYYRGAEVKRIY
ncbi:MAG: SpoIID/LytB domain-containing protein [Myxococcota bacterium]